ncbi:hypothetical protein DM02DRAFT_668201 [Periconia macrospinosa]|uniref:NACHT domain-containing protein n=1 Tax=Periconia macrospinosa TaxID=97972 RepID=A0A2V1E601_9PLEO|nr:hypothetical protein DM02DRAFT_668201 [Periconia macrospinosa]
MATNIRDVRTALPIPTEPWETAKARFLAGLTPAELKNYEDATPENLFYDASAAQKKHASSSRSWIVQERITSLVQGIEEYGKALDVFANTSSLILCPLWGSIRVVIQIAAEAGKFQEKVVDMLAQIGDIIPRFRIYQVLYGKHERLLSALTEAYLDVLRFCTDVKTFFQRAKRSLIPLSIVLQGSWSSFRQRFENTMMKFRRHQKLVEKEASLSHQIEAAKSRELELAQRMQNDRIRTRFNMLSALRAVDYEIKHTKLLAAKHPGTNEWMKEHDRYKDWIASPTSNCLPCYGIPGSGKSILSASITSWLAEKLDADSVLCYYYCDYTDIVSLDSSYLMASLIKQLLVRLPLERVDDSLNFPFQEGLPPPSMRASRDCLIRLFQEFKIIYIVIDAIDELVQEDQRHILDLVTHLLNIPSPSFTIRIFLTSRSEDHSIRTALRDHKSINLSTTEVSGDISGYIQGMVDSIKEDNPLLKNDNIKQNVLSALVSGAQGMFLWARFQVLEIAEAFSESDIQEALDNLPKDLGETYMRIVQKAYRRGGTQRIELINKICRWLACAQRPLKIEELEEAIAIEKTDTYLHRDRIALGSGHRLVGACGNLVTIHDADGTVDFAHHTVKQFMCTKTLGNTLIHGVSIHINTESAHKELGEICVAYLSFSDFETQIVKTPAQFELGPKEAEAMIWNNNVPLRKYLKPIISGRISNKKSTESQHSDSLYFPIPLENKALHELQTHYALLEYIADFWFVHTAAFSRRNTNFWYNFKHLVLERTLPFDFRPWTRLAYKSNVEARLTNLYLEKLSRSRRWDKSHPSSNPLDANRKWHLDGMCFYTWVIREGYQSMFPLLKKEPLDEYLRVVYPWSESGFLDSHIIFEPITLALAYKTSSFWAPLNIVSQLNVQAPSATKTSQLLHFLWHEYRRWVEKEDEFFHSLALEAIPIAFNMGYGKIYPVLMRHLEKYSRNVQDVFAQLKSLGMPDDAARKVILSAKSAKDVEWES